MNRRTLVSITDHRDLVLDVMGARCVVWLEVACASLGSSRNGLFVQPWRCGSLSIRAFFLLATRCDALFEPAIVAKTTSGQAKTPSEKFSFLHVSLFPLRNLGNRILESKALNSA